MIQIAPSILAADQGHLADQVEATFKAGVRRLHVDVMDGRFVPNITIGPTVVAALRPIADRYGAVIETHLMIVEPDLWLAPFREAGADVLIVHVEAAAHLHRTLVRIRELGGGPGAAVNPATPLTALEEVLDELDMALVMTVEPGFGGQHFMPEPAAKISEVKRLLAGRPGALVHADGGVSADTAAVVGGYGVDVCIVGSALFQRGQDAAREVEAVKRNAGSAPWQG